MIAAPLPGDALTQACGAEPSLACRLLFNTTGSGGTAQFGDAVTGVLLPVVLILALAYVALRMTRVLINRAVRRFEDSDGQTGQRARTIIGGLFQNVAKTVIAAVAGVMVLQELGISVGPLLVGLGVVGLRWPSACRAWSPTSCPGCRCWPRTSSARATWSTSTATSA